MLDDETIETAAFWADRLGVRQPGFRYVSRARWDGNTARRHQFGVDKETGEFFYSKKPREVDIVHELCHLAFPHLPEKDIRKITKALTD